jgi:hypothetical protein
MTGPNIVRYVSGDWNDASGHVRLRIESDCAGEPQELLVALADVQPLVVLLLMLSSKAGARQPHASSEVRRLVPLRLNSVGIGESEDGEIVLQIDVGETALAFVVSPGLCEDLGRALMTVSAHPTRQPAN